jgi:hypothetical protein
LAKVDEVHAVLPEARGVRGTIIARKSGTHPEIEAPGNYRAVHDQE